MTQQKLYTEKEIRRTFGSGFTEIRFRRYMNELTPIEIPTDEEIEEGLFHHSNEYAIGFKEAIKFLREQILNK